MLVFEFSDYKKYLRNSLDEMSLQTRGIRTKLAKALNCQPGYISQTLNGNAHLSAEQADGVNKFLSHTEDESQYFLLLVLREKSGTSSLKNHFEKQIAQLQKLHLNLKHRFKVEDTISDQHQSIFYSSWQNIAVLAALGISDLQTKESLSNHFGLPTKRIAEILELLMKAQLVRVEKGRYSVTVKRTHLGSNSHLINRHHINWRLQAIQSLEKGSDSDLHYSSVVSISKADVEKIKMRIVKDLGEYKKIIGASQDETLCVFSVDFFGI